METTKACVLIEKQQPAPERTNAPDVPAAKTRSFNFLYVGLSFFSTCSTVHQPNQIRHRERRRRERKKRTKARQVKTKEK